MHGMLQDLSLLEVLDELERALDLRYLDLHRLLGLVHVGLHQLVLAETIRARQEQVSKRALDSGSVQSVCLEGCAGKHKASGDPPAIGQLWSMDAPPQSGLV